MNERVLREFTKLQTLLLLTFVSIVVGETIPTLPNNYHLPNKTQLPLKSWQKGRIISASNSAPIARLFQNDADAVESFKYLLKFFKRSERQLGKIQKRAKNPNASWDDKQRNCNVPCCLPKYYSARLSLSLFKYGELPKKRCVTELKDDGTDKHMKAITSFTRGLNKIAKAASDQMFNNWTYAEANSRFTYNTTFHKCTMEHVVGLRIDGFWSVVARLVNAPAEKELAEWKRHYYTENLVLRPNGSVDAFPSYYPEKSYLRKTVPSTTRYDMWGGAMDASYFGEASIVENYAIRAALAASEVLRQQAEDSTTPSNILILMFPLIMVLVPLGLFADVGYWVTVAYSFVTDFMATMPLAVKGVELLKFGSESHTATRMFMFALENPKALGAAEVWSAECTAGDHMRRLGTIFLVIALIGMTIGLTLEVVVWKKVRSNKVDAAARQKAYDASTDVEHLWTRKPPPCTTCSCDTDLRKKQGQRPGQIAGGLISHIIDRRRRG